MIELRDFNALPRGGAIEELRKCCGTEAWCEAVADARPFESHASLIQCAHLIWDSLSSKDWREAFDHHPRIGGLEDLRKKFPSTKDWAGEEQGGVAHAAESTLHKLADGNARYEARYGHIFLVCATGKSAEEMLAILESRMGNTPEAELAIAAAEQAKITRIRLEKLIT